MLWLAGYGIAGIVFITKFWVSHNLMAQKIENIELAQKAIKEQVDHEIQGINSKQVDLERWTQKVDKTVGELGVKLEMSLESIKSTLDDIRQRLPK